MMRSSDPIRGLVMLIAAAIALWKGWHMHGNRAGLAYLLAGLALAMAVWHLKRATAEPKA